MGKGSGASSEDLDKRVGVLNFVGVLLGIVIDTLHAITFGSSLNTGLCSVDIVVETIEGAANNQGRDTLDDDLHVVELIDLTSANRVVSEGAHRPSKGTTLVEESVVELLLALGDQVLVSGVSGLGDDHVLLCLDGGHSRRSNAVNSVEIGLAGCKLRLGAGNWLVVLDNSIVGDMIKVRIGRRSALEEQRTLDEIVPLDGVVLVDDLGVDKWNKEESRQETNAATGSHGDSSDIPTGLLAETQVGRALVDNGERADGSGDEEPDRSSVNSPLGGVLADMDDKLDEQEDGGSKPTSNAGSHTQTSKDGTETLSFVPSPLDLGGTDSGNADASDGRDERVGGGDVSRVSSAPHDPGRGGSQGTCKGEHLNTGIALEGVVGDDAVLDGIGSTSTDSDGAKHLEDCAQDHGLAVGDGSR